MARTKVTSHIDAQVGARLRIRRMVLGMSQEKLGDASALLSSKCRNTRRARIEWGRARQQHAADILGVAVPFFFEGAGGGTFRPDRNRHRQPISTILSPLHTAFG